MVNRKGVLVVPVDHPLQPSGTAMEIQDIAQKVIERIRDIFHISERSLSFQIRSYSNSSNPIVSILESVTDGHPDRDEIRIIFSDRRIPDDTVKRFLAKNTLVIVGEETSGIAQITALDNATGCRVSLPLHRAVRFIEDIFIDIFMGRWLKQNAVFLKVIKEHGLPELFREKARYFKKNSTDGYISQIAKDAGYAPLAALNKCADNDIDGRAKATMHSWNQLQSSLAGEATSNHRRVIELNKKSVTKNYPRGFVPISEKQPLSASKAKSKLGLKSVPKLGKQLPLAKIANAAAKLPDGSYTLLILVRSSTVRKNPKTRNKIRSLFGVNARINSFKFVSNAEFFPARKMVGELLENNFVAGLRVEITGSEVALSPNPSTVN